MPKGDSSLRQPGRKAAIITTAALPWRTGTAVNPLLRAAYLAHQQPDCQVSLVVPWLTSADQAIIFPDSLGFQDHHAQEAHIKAWVQKRTGFAAAFEILWYPGYYDPAFKSILPSGDVIQYIPEDQRDVAILEEPEHLNWFQSKRRWSETFPHVVGIMHTNYVDYVQREAGAVGANIMYQTTRWLTRCHCHKVIKLSDAIQKLPRSVTCFVHGVAKDFLAVGERKAAVLSNGKPRFSKGAYFIGKAVWGKGYTELLELMRGQAGPDGKPLHIDIYGSGEDLDAIKARAAEFKVDASFLGAADHLSERIEEYQVFVNPSLSDVVATTSAEALAMGKWLICAVHPENEFFSSFANCLQYSTPQEFAAQLRHALQNEPHPLVGDDLRRLTWEEATERFLDASAIRADEWPSRGNIARTATLWTLYRPVMVLDGLRSILGYKGGHADARSELEGFLHGETSESDTDIEEGGSTPRPQSGLHVGITHNSGNLRLQIP